MKIRAEEASGTTLTFSGNGGNSATSGGDDTALIGAAGGRDGGCMIGAAAATLATLGAPATRTLASPPLRLASSATWMLSSLTILARTRAVPLVAKPRSWEARRDTSMILPRANGPRSLTRSWSVRPLLRLVTWTMLGIGK